MKGDRVEIVIDAGSGTTRTYEVAATRAGRRVNVTHGRGVVEVSEVTRGGTVVRTGRFMANRIVALVEHPAAEEGVEDRGPRALRLLGPQRGPVDPLALRHAFILALRYSLDYDCIE